MTTLVNTSWTGKISRPGNVQEVTITFQVGTGNISTGNLTFNYTQVFQNGIVQSFDATPTAQNFVQSGKGVLDSPSEMSGIFNLQGTIWSFQVTLNS